MHYSIQKFLKEKGWKVSDIQFIPNHTKGNGLMMICPDGTICDCECESEKINEGGEVIG